MSNAVEMKKRLEAARQARLRMEAEEERKRREEEERLAEERRIAEEAERKRKEEEVKRRLLSEKKLAEEKRFEERKAAALAELAARMSLEKVVAAGKLPPMSPRTPDFVEGSSQTKIKAK